MAKLTIITINYNNASGLERTLSSIREQELEHVEYVIIDGGSKDNSVSLIEANRDIIDFWVSEPDKGVYDAMNKGIEKANGEYILFLNSGDHFYNNSSLQEHLVHMADEDIICFNINTIHGEVTKIKEHPKQMTFDYLFNDTLAHQSTLIKRTLFKKVGHYDTSLKIVADWKFFVDAIVKHGASYKSVPSILTTYYLDGMSATAKGTNIRKSERRNVLKMEYPFLNDDYKELQLLKSNRFKILKVLEKSALGRKLNSLWLRVLLFLMKGKSVNNID